MLNVMRVQQVVNSIKTHGVGLLNSTVNAAYQLLKKKFQALSQFLYDGGPTPLGASADGEDELLTKEQIQELIEEYTRRMQEAADQMEFESAADFRDKLLVLKDMDLGLKPPSRALVQATRAKKQEQGKELPRYRRGAGNRRRR